MRTKVWSSVIQAALLVTLVIGCKKAVDPDPVTPSTTPPTLVGNWKITGLTFSPAWNPQIPGATPVPDYIPYLKAQGQTCLTDLTVSFTAAGAYSTNSRSTASCGSAPESKTILDYVFGEGNLFTETDTDVVLFDKGNITSLRLKKSGTNQLLTIQFEEAEDISAKPVRTTYSIVMARQ